MPAHPELDGNHELDRQAAELEAMRRVLAASRGSSSLSVAICNSPALRDHIIARLVAGEPAIETVSLPNPCLDPYGEVAALAANPQRSALFVLNMERSISSDSAQQPTLSALNASRELWRTAFHCPVVIWLPEYAATQLSIHARDFWAWVSHRFEFISEAATLSRGMSSVPMGLSQAMNLDLDRKRFRLAELEQRIAEAGPEPAGALIPFVSDWLIQAALLCKSLGDLDHAEEMLRKALAIEEKLGRQEGIARAYGNLGLIYRTRGDLDRAEAMYLKALAINEKLGRQEGMSIAYGNLGNIYLTRGDLDRAEEMYLKALEINEKLGLQEGIAIVYGNLGNKYETRGDLDRAEEMYLKALEIDEKLGGQEGMATEYGNLGNIYLTRGDLDRAEEMLRKALAIEERLGRQAGMAMAYGNLGNIYLTRGDLDRAEEMYLKALEINEKLGLQEGMAIQYGNVGSIFDDRGDRKQARQYWTKALELFTKIGMAHEIELMRSNLDSNPEQ